METEDVVLSSATIDEFKSYYVVWKQNRPRMPDIGHRRFKSYYVVWKLYRIRVYSFPSCVFKSYYVVWKPVCTHKILVGEKSLNRTM